jgi:hypothetical protein
LVFDDRGVEDDGEMMFPCLSRTCLDPDCRALILEKYEDPRLYMENINDSTW